MNSFQKNKKISSKENIDLIGKKNDTVPIEKKEAKEIKLNLKAISKHFDGEFALKDINIYVEKGEIVSLIGPSGCGKSTIFNIIADLVKQDSGICDVYGEISYMYQMNLLLPYKTIIDNVCLPLTVKGVKKKAAHKEVSGYFEIFGLEGYENRYPNELSGGMKQRANFMRTFVHSNDIMLLDEPFGALDSITKMSLIEWFLEIRKKLKPTVMLITHDIDEAIAMSDRIYVLSNKPTVVLEEIDLSSYDKSRDILELSTVKKEVMKTIKDNRN